MRRSPAVWMCYRFFWNRKCLESSNYDNNKDSYVFQLIQAAPSKAHRRPSPPAAARQRRRQGIWNLPHLPPPPWDRLHHCPPTGTTHRQTALLTPRELLWVILLLSLLPLLLVLLLLFILINRVFLFQFVFIVYASLTSFFLIQDIFSTERPWCKMRTVCWCNV